MASIEDRRCQHGKQFDDDCLLCAIIDLEEENERLRKSQQWIAVEDELPEDGTSALVYIPETDNEFPDIQIEFWHDGEWGVHSDSYEHYMAVGGANAVPGETCTGPTAKAPYTHWQPLPAPPEPKQ